MNHKTSFSCIILCFLEIEQIVFFLISLICVMIDLWTECLNLMVGPDGHMLGAVLNSFAVLCSDLGKGHVASTDHEQQKYAGKFS